MLSSRGGRAAYEFCQEVVAISEGWDNADPNGRTVRIQPRSSTGGVSDFNAAR